ncbi:GIY-YIG nuclease family protein [Candidatus Uhrbacteria bacterium]|nr:GIY-YIG nuclease family protein [Candidatus Uhrbacteria bacterium]
MFYVYVIESESSGKWYIGYSSNLRARLQTHNQNGNASTSNRGSWKLIYYEAYVTKEDAMGREKFLKSGSGWRYLKKQLYHYLDDRETIAINSA